MDHESRYVLGIKSSLAKAWDRDAPYVFVRILIAEPDRTDIVDEYLFPKKWNVMGQVERLIIEDYKIFNGLFPERVTPQIWVARIPPPPYDDPNNESYGLLYPWRR